MNTQVKSELLISPFLVMFLVHGTQYGIGVLSFQRSLVKIVGNDAWISIIATGIVIHFLIWILYSMLNKNKGDLISIHQQTFGKWLGNFLSTLYILFILSQATIVLRSYIEIVQVWMFPLLKTWPFALVILLGVYYVVIGGFRVVTGVCFLAVVVPFYLIFTFFAPIEFSNFRNLLPIFDHSFIEMAQSLKGVGFTFSGFEYVLFYYPFIKRPESSQKWAHFANLFTTALYLFIMVITLAYFEKEYLKTVIWPTLMMWKIVELPFVERFEIIGVTSWAVVMMPIICVMFWAASRAIKQVFKVKQRKSLVLLLFICFIVSCSLTNREKIQQYNDWITEIGFYIIFLYLPLLFICFHIRYKVRGKS
ncbi:GerAB/ArcD/ProY family transporter [Neobacillus mesonae]|uniref:GerAB/ArcD/ProY family transporter n=1 Tax=Neobacillus mesonae TaxID=1193713 RepID=UPI002E24BB5D|nr:GerAB/ArcD/ProY family transporter [Neobacillus mesonae]MED4202806.1 GerAB/ArcD/ProY family transporter [Neobacillus mesonae]